MHEQLEDLKNNFIFSRIEEALKGLHTNDEYEQVNKKCSKKINEIEDIVGFKLINEYTELNSELSGYIQDEIYKRGFKDSINILFDILFNKK